MANEMKQDGGPAFPVSGEAFSAMVAAVESMPADDQAAMAGKVADVARGMTLRDYFAAKALQGLLANSEGVNGGAEPAVAALFRDRKVVTDYADLAHDIADAMLKARGA